MLNFKCQSMTVGILGLNFFWTVGILAQKFTVVGKLGVGIFGSRRNGTKSLCCVRLLWYKFSEFAW